MPMLKIWREPLWIVCSLLIVLTGCGGPLATPTLLKIVVTPSNLEIGDTAALQAVAHLSNGKTQDVTADTQWSISDPSLATLTRATMIAKAAGSLTIQATYGDLPPDQVTVTTISVVGTLTSSAQVVIAARQTTKVTPAITWNTPSPIRFGTLLTSEQLNALANVPGTYSYTPAAGAKLRAGTQSLGLVFTPNDTSRYEVAYQSVALQVHQVIPTIAWPAPAPIEQGTALNGTQLNATSNVFGTFTYHPAVGTVLPSGTQSLGVSFSPNDTTDYASVTATNSITVNGSGSTSPPPPPPGCGGPTVNLNSSMSTSEIQNAITDAADCSVISFAAGTYNITSAIVIPCPATGFTIAGPAVAWPGPYQATLYGSVSGNWGFEYGPCSSPVTIEYLEWNGGEPAAGGGGFLYLAPSTSNLTIQNNFIHGNQANTSYDDEYDTLIWFDGVDTATPSQYDNNNTIAWNIFGSTNDGTATNADCGAIADLLYYQGGYYDQIGGYCAALGLHSSTNNLTVTNNIIQYQEEGFKLFEGGSVTGQLFYDSNLNFTYNDLSYIHRIGVEGQQNANPSMNFNFNDMHDETYPAWSTWGFSFAQSGNTNCLQNIFIANTLIPGDPTGGPGSVEFWGGGSCSNNLVQGYWGAGMQYGFGQDTWAMNNNIIQQLADTDYIGNEESITCCYPQMIGNVESQQLSTVVSAAPTISPNPSGIYSGQVTVTLTDTGVTNGGVGPQGNTTIYYTTDGSTPTTSSTACNPTPGSTSCSIQVAAGTTVQAIGMWGAINQPKSYPAGYGFVPSAVVGASYQAAVVNRPGVNVNSKPGFIADSNPPATVPVLESVGIVPANATVNIGGTTQLKALALFSDGSTKDVTTDFGWISSDLRTVSVTSLGLVSGLATGKAQLSGSYQGQQALVPVSSSIGDVDWSGPLVITKGGTYSGSWQSTDPKTPAVMVATQEPVIIQDSHFSSSGDLIQAAVKGADITVRNSLGVALNPLVKGRPNGTFLDVASPRRLDVENNYMENVRDGVSVSGYSGDQSANQTLVIRNNRVRNLNGLLSDGAGGYQTERGPSHGQSRFVELNNVQSVPGIDVGWNEVVDYPTQSLATDVIDVYRASGTINQPLQVHDLYIQDAHRGGGIKTEGAVDDTVQDTSAYMDIHDNQVVGTVSYGIAFNAGHDNVAANNRVISTAVLADGTKVVGQQAGLLSVNPHGGTSYNNTMHDNLVGWGCTTAPCVGAQFLPASPGDYSSNTVLTTREITSEMEGDEFQLWLSKIAAAGVRVGPSF
jgi:Bacterial Ig-like domain (group 2)/Chitobiase/beta-hexosaminidase C-terminal domain